MNLANYVKCHQRFIAAHRGASAYAPENTLSAFQKAIECGAVLVEADIQITKDSQPIVFHDDNLLRITGEDCFVSDLNYNELNRLSAGKWFSNEYSNEKIPLLSELIELINNKAFLGLEIKSSDNIDQYIENVINIVKKYNYIANTIFASFDYNALAAIKSIEPFAHIAAVKLPNDVRLPSQLKDDFGIEAYICSIEEIDNNIIDDIQKSNIILGAYSIDSEELFAKAMTLPIHAIGTNYPCQMSKLLQNYTY